ncbi:MAG TPA: exonuclease domain-containing protein, partial [Burkholderiales bacterium]
MRQIFLDTETTGLDPALGHRVIEIAAVEIVNRRFTDRHYHQYVDPEREIDTGALEVHGITVEFLADKPKFREVAADMIG